MRTFGTHGMAVYLATAVAMRKVRVPSDELLDKLVCQWFAAVHAGRRGHRGPCRSGRRTRSGARAPAGRARGATFGGDARRTRRAAPPEGQLPPADARVARTGPGRRGAPLGWADRAAAGRQRGVLRRVAGCARCGGLGRPGAHRRPAVRALSHRRGREDRSRGRRAAARPQAGRDVRARHRDPLRRRRRPCPRSPTS